MKGESGQTEIREGSTRIERGLALVSRYRHPHPPDELSEEEKDLYHEANKAMIRAWHLNQILGEDVSASAAADKFITLASVLADSDDGPWGVESGQCSEQIKNLVSPFLAESVGIGNVLQAARDMKKKPDVFHAYVELVKNGTLDRNVLAALQHLARNR